MVRDQFAPLELPPARQLVAKVLDGEVPAGIEFDAWRQLVRAEPATEIALIALTSLLEGALADATFGIGDTQQLVPLLKALGRRQLTVPELL